MKSGGFYVATAYRWGWRNAHSYTVHASYDDMAVQLAAEREAKGRGGKYGVEVIEYRPISKFGFTEKVVLYCPSLYGEEGAHINRRMELFEAIGNPVVAAIEYSRDEPDTAKPVNDWIKERHAHEVQIMKIFDDSAKKAERGR